jgi:hypothetical protein
VPRIEGRAVEREVHRILDVRAEATGQVDHIIALARLDGGIAGSRIAEIMRFDFGAGFGVERPSDVVFARTTGKGHDACRDQEE